MVLATLGLFGLSLLLIWKGSDWMTDSLIPIAKKLGTSYVAITTLVVSLLLSIPEIFSAVYATAFNHIELGLGVIIGSVMANIGLTVGVSAAMKPLTIEKTSVIRDGIFMIIVVGAVLLFGSDLEYTRTEGLILLLFFIPYAINVWYFEKIRSKSSRELKMLNTHKSLSLIGGFFPWKMKASIWTFFVGGGVLVVGSWIFAKSLIGITNAVLLPELFIGLTAGAIGPALPNLIAAIQGTRKGFTDAAITETFGSNIFTLLITLGVILLINPFSITGKVFYFDMTWMLIMHVLLIAFILKGFHYREESITRYEGWALILFYVGLLLVNLVWF